MDNNKRWAIFEIKGIDKPYWVLGPKKCTSEEIEEALSQCVYTVHIDALNMEFKGTFVISVISGDWSKKVAQEYCDGLNAAKHPFSWLGDAVDAVSGEDQEQEVDE